MANLIVEKIKKAKTQEERVSIKASEIKLKTKLGKFTYHG